MVAWVHGCMGAWGAWWGALRHTAHLCFPGDGLGKLGGHLLLHCYRVALLQVMQLAAVDAREVAHAEGIPAQRGNRCDVLVLAMTELELGRLLLDWED